MRTWSLSATNGSYTLTIYDSPLWKDVAETVWDKFCGLTQGWAGGHGLPDIFWKIPIGQPVRHLDGDLKNSVAEFFLNIENKVFEVTDNRQHKVREIELSVDLARAIDPEFVSSFEELDDNG